MGYEDEGGGLHLVGNRRYGTDTGRFLTLDPACDGSNRWSYCEGDPVNAVDSTGLEGDWLEEGGQFFGGWGDPLTFGATGAISQALNGAFGYGSFGFGGPLFEAGRVVGDLNALLIPGAQAAGLGRTAISIGARFGRGACGSTSSVNLAEHFAKHGKDVGAATAKIYDGLSVAVTQRRGVLAHGGKDGKHYLYDPTTRKIVVVEQCGIMTFYKASSKYWERIIKR